MDALLCAWLAESDPVRAEVRFGAYFRVAFPAICRYVRSFRVDPATAEEIAQRALIKLFDHLGRKRVAADSRVREAVTTLRPLNYGELHALSLIHI